MGHIQPPTPLQTDNYMAEAVVNGKNTTKMNKGNGYALSLVKRPRMPGAIQNILETRNSNYADYWTKHPPSKHHWNTQKEFLTPHIVLEMLNRATISSLRADRKSVV